MAHVCPPTTPHPRSDDDPVTYTIPSAGPGAAQVGRATRAAVNVTRSSWYVTRTQGLN